MPELPDIEAYLCALRPRLLGRSLLRVRRASPFILRTVAPAIATAEGREIVALRRLGKRIAIGLAGELWLVLHLMIAGRLHWRPPEAALQGRNALLALDLADGSLVLTEAGVQVGVQLPTPQPDLIADPVQLQQVILNLVINAVDAMREQSGRARRLDIAVTPDPAGGLCFAVRDSGPGIAEDSEARLFEAFFSTKPDGLGMGLAISRSIVENHGGRLWLDRTQGPGACFLFTIPDG